MRRALVAFIAWSSAAAAIAAAPARSPGVAWPAPKPVKVLMTVDRSSPVSAVINEAALGINVDVSRGGGDSFWINGYLKGNAQAFDRRTTHGGVSIMGGGVNVDVRPLGGRTYLLSGIYKDADGKDGSMSVRLNAAGAPLRDMAAHEQGLDLLMRWRATGYEIEGKADPKVYGRRELAILGTAVAALTWDSTGR